MLVYVAISHDVLCQLRFAFVSVSH